MTADHPLGTSDQPLVHQFIRLFGRRPTPQELEQFQNARAAIAGERPLRLRHRAARLITRL